MTNLEDMLANADRNREEREERDRAERDRAARERQSRTVRSGIVQDHVSIVVYGDGGWGCAPCGFREGLSPCAASGFRNLAGRLPNGSGRYPMRFCGFK